MTIKSKVREKTGGGCVAVGFCLIFAIAGLAAFYFLTFRPIAGLVMARSWEELPCTILTSEVDESHSSDGTTYRVAITYSYDFAGESYRGNRYDFSEGYSSGYDGKARAVADYPVGIETFCYVDPDAPEQSVIDRSPGLYLLWGLFPLPFLAVGLGGLFLITRGATLRSPRGQKAVRRSGRTPAPTTASSGATVTERAFVATAPATAPVDDRGYVALESHGSAVGRLIGITIFAAIWNPFVGFAFYTSVRGSEPWGCHTLFLLPFVVVGLGLIVGIVHQGLALFNPRPHLILNDTHLTVGETCSVRWWLSGRAARLRRLTVELEGREAATYRQGTNTRTDHHVFYSAKLVELDHPTGEPRGMAELHVPEDTMPSFTASNNKIEWRLVVHGDIPFWPDVKEAFFLTIHPAPRTS